MEYKRLTTKDENGDIIVNCQECQYHELFCMICTDYHCINALKTRLAELEDKIENGTLVELEKPYIRQLNSIPQQDKYIICKAQEVGISGVLTKAEAEKKLKELRGEV